MYFIRTWISTALSTKQLKHRKACIVRARYDVIQFSDCNTKEQSEVSSFVQFENEMASYRALELNKAQLSMF